MQSEVKYVDRGVEFVGTYRIDGWMLELTCSYGTRRATLGLLDERALARKLLKFLVLRAGKEVASTTPHPAAIEANARIAVPAAPLASHKG